MRINHLTEDVGVFGPDKIAVLTAAQEGTLYRLGITDRAGQRAKAVAKTIMALAMEGECDSERLREAAVRELADY